jgi:hypothetical protein
MRKQSLEYLNERYGRLATEYGWTVSAGKQYNRLRASWDPSKIPLREPRGASR